MAQDLAKFSSAKLYMIRNQNNAQLIDAELDRRNKAIGSKVNKKRAIKGGMIDAAYEIEAAKYNGWG